MNKLINSKSELRKSINYINNFMHYSANIKKSNDSDKAIDAETGKTYTRLPMSRTEIIDRKRDIQELGKTDAKAAKNASRDLFEEMFRRANIPQEAFTKYSDARKEQIKVLSTLPEEKRQEFISALQSGTPFDVKRTTSGGGKKKADEEIVSTSITPARLGLRSDVLSALNSGVGSSHPVTSTLVGLPNFLSDGESDVFSNSNAVSEAIGAYIDLNYGSHHDGDVDGPKDKSDVWYNGDPYYDIGFPREPGYAELYKNKMKKIQEGSMTPIAKEARGKNIHWLLGTGEGVDTLSLSPGEQKMIRGTKLNIDRASNYEQRLANTLLPNSKENISEIQSPYTGSEHVGDLADTTISGVKKLIHDAIQSGDLPIEQASNVHRVASNFGKRLDDAEKRLIGSVSRQHRTGVMETLSRRLDDVKKIIGDGSPFEGNIGQHLENMQREVRKIGPAGTIDLSNYDAVGSILDAFGIGIKR